MICFCWENLERIICFCWENLEQVICFCWENLEQNNQDNKHLLEQTWFWNINKSFVFVGKREQQLCFCWEKGTSDLFCWEKCRNNIFVLLGKP